MAVGKLSFDDWLRLTWSFGCTGVLLASHTNAKQILAFAVFQLGNLADPIAMEQPTDLTK
jgi:hypothetical protein